ncbi:class I SAM-dependent methyltransferase [Coprobacter secundus]|uniref:AraC family transcriptional regulator n=1 Tax=Coprobacter secundus subsp. similis TaxID=2751153 RepID=A0A7G1HU61_9BACT|nr:class I SAM-dependent methyltransferase [Coprobacter secundus]BCI62302.1 AraC family transcriptional regulator [Coprobacter secundus subsp. similis]CCY35869.1 putative uncharacterized protein [Tannerella sp. CAG:118]
MNIKADFFNSVAFTWDKMCRYDDKKIRFLLQLLDICPNDSILDVGTGTGVLIPYFREVNPLGKIIAIDNSPKMIEVAQKKFSREKYTQFLISDVELDCIHETFNHIVLYSVFPHIENKIDTILKLINKNLKKEGKLLIAHSDSRNRLNDMHKRKNKSVCNDILIDVQKQANLFSQAGLHVKDAFENEELYYLLLTQQ